MQKPSVKNDQFLLFVQKYESIVRFLFVGTINTFIDLSLYSIFANLIGASPIFSSLLSTGITLCFSFFMNYYFVFRSSRDKKQSAVLFILTTLFNVWVIQSLVIALSLRILNETTYFVAHKWTLNIVAKLCGVSVSLVLNYIGYRFIFSKPEVQGGTHGQ